jgi:hypothetical protein
MSPLHANNKKIQMIAQHFKLVFIFACFVLVLIFLHPSKDDLLKRVLTEQTNYALTALYLAHIQKISPGDHELKFEMFETLFKQGKFNYLLVLFTEMEKPLERVKYSDEIKKRYFKLKMDTLEALYFKAKVDIINCQNGCKEQTKILKQIKQLIDRMIEVKLYYPQDKMFWYRVCHEFSLYKEALYFGDKLDNKDKLSNLMDQLELAIAIEDSRNIQKYLKLIVDLFSISEGAAPVDENYLLGKKFRKFKKIYFKVINYYQVTGDEQGAVLFARQHQEHYIKDRHASQELIKFYLSVGYLKDAHYVALKQFEMME